MKTLYRFERATERRASTLTRRKLWASKPKFFNDLTDCQLDFDAFAESRWERTQLLQAIDALYPNGAFPESLPLSSGAFEMLLKQAQLAGSDLNESLWRAAAQVTLSDSISESVAVCCFFGADRLNPLMWAHYGDNHRGMCVEYEVPDFESVELHEVEYSSMRPTVTLTELLFSPWESVLRVVRSKHLDWAYEQEQRMVLINREARESTKGLEIACPSWLLPRRLIVGARVDEALRLESGESPLQVAVDTAAALAVPVYRVALRGQELVTEKLLDVGQDLAEIAK